MARAIRGVEAHQEIKARTEWRDIRTGSEKFRAWMQDGDGMMMMGILITGSMIALPALMEVIFLMGMLLFWWAGRLPITLPFRLPRSTHLLDYNDPKPGSEEPGKAAGIAFLGNEVGTKRELWFKRDDMRTHILIFGSTGSGKALPDEAMVHTPHGWVRIDTLKEGDKVTTADGKTSPITGVFPQGKLSVYRLILEDGRTVLASGDHLWAVHPHMPSGPLQVLSERTNGTNEVIDTLELQRRLDMGFWPEGAQGWALPLPGTPDCQPHPEAGDSDILARDAVLSLSGKGRFPKNILSGSKKQREAFWKSFWGMSTQLCEHMGRSSLVASTSKEAVKALMALSHSMGWWACIENDTTTPETSLYLNIRRNEAGVRVVRVENIHQSMSCRCIKIDDPKGLFLTDGWVVTHNTEALLSIAYNSLVHGSGFIYIDGKGDSSLWAKIFSMCRSLGREDDLLVINYMTGGQDVFGAQETKLSNTMNPFINGSSGGLTELLVGLMDDGSSGGSGDMWKGRAVSLAAAVLTALVYLRDNEGLLLDVDVIRDHLGLDKIQDLSKRRDLPVNIVTPIRAYLRSLPGYQEAAPNGKQNETALEQHGYLQMQFTRILGSLSDTYGYIFRTNLGEVDFRDVVLNRRILVVLLPAMEKSQDELSNLGKIIVACIKQMMSTCLGDVLEGSFKKVIETKPTTSDAPFTCILDEYGYYVVKGAAVMPAQARSLGFCMVFAGQDYPSFKKNNNAEEAAATIGNCNIKIFMKVEDPTETFDLFKQSVGEAQVSKTTGFIREGGLMGAKYSDQQNASVERRARGEWLDLKDQREGEAHILFKSTLVRANFFYAQPDDAPDLKMNYFMRVKPPEREKMTEVDTMVSSLEEKLNDQRYLNEQVNMKIPMRLTVAAQVLKKYLDEKNSPRDAGIKAIIAAHRLAYANLDTLSSMSKNLSEEFDDEDNEDEDSIDIYGSNIEDDNMGDFEIDGDEEGFSPDRYFLNPEKTRERLTDLEMAAGADEETARRKGHSQAEDLRIISTYPKNHLEPVEPDEIQGLIEDLGDDLSIDQDD